MKHLFIPNNRDFEVIASLAGKPFTNTGLTDTRNERRLRAAASIVTEALNKARRNS